MEGREKDTETGHDKEQEKKELSKQLKEYLRILVMEVIVLQYLIKQHANYTISKTV